MLHADVLTLIADTEPEKGRFETTSTTARDVLCTVRSVGMRESYEALGHGLHPERVFVLSHDFEYQGETRCRYHGIDYRIVRTYVTEADGIELTVERSNAHV